MAAAGASSNVPQFASLYVGDLHQDVTEAMLYEIFNAVGPVGSIRVCRDSLTRKSLGYGYVNFHNVADAERALDTLNYSSIKGRACRIMWSQRDPSLRKSGVGNIFVRNLDRNIDNKALYDTFSLFGNILSCKVSANLEGKSFGYGFVHYETEEAAKQAIERVNGMQIGEKTVEVTVFKKWDERDPGVYTNLYIKNLPDDTDDEKLKARFGAYGPIDSFALMEDKFNRKFAFVNFEDAAHAKAALEAEHGKDLRTDEQKENTKEDADPESYLLYVRRAQSKAERARELRKQAVAKPSAKGPAPGVNLYVKNLDENMTDDSLKDLFKEFGTITSCVAVKDDKDKCKGFGFVCFSNPEEATKAVTEMHLKVVKGKPLYVGLAERKDVRQERLRQRYSAGGPGMGGGMGGGMGPMGGKGFDGGKGGKGFDGGKGGKGKMDMSQAMGGMMGNPMMGMMGKGMTSPQAQMMAQKGAMMNPAMMGKGNPMMGMMNPAMMGKGNPMMGMMPPQMMGMMGKGGPMGMTGPMGMMRPMMPNPMMMGMRPPAGPMAGGPARPMGGPGAPLTAAALAAAPLNVQKQMLGEKLFPQIQKLQPELAGKITGMMLEMDNSELLILLESEAQLKGKVDEAMRVLESTGGRA